MSVAVRQAALLRVGHRPHVWTVSFSKSALVGVREDAAVGLVANVSQNGDSVRNDFDRVPIFQRPIFNATWDRHSQSWVNLTPLGAPDFTWSPTVPYREVVYRCRPFWYRLELEELGPMRVSVTDRALPGYTLAPMFKNGRTPVYRPAFEMGIGEDGLPHSRAGLEPYRTNGVELMKAAHAYDAAARAERLADWMSDLLLLLVEMATWSFGSIMSGNTSLVADSSGAVLPHLKASSGSLGDGLSCVWRGKENPWKGINSFLCDLMIRKVVSATGNSLELWHLPDVRCFDGTLNNRYRKLDNYLTNSTGMSDYRGLRLASGLLYPALKGSAGVSIKGVSYMYANFANDRPVLLAAGGGSTNAMLSPDVKASPLHMEATELGSWRAEHFGARLVLDEGGAA